MKVRLIIILIPILFATSCMSKMLKGDEITATELHYIKELGLLDENETIILFDSQASFEVSGNFFTDKRIASYWQNQKDDDHAIFAYYETIDSIILVDRIRDLSYASYLEVFVNDASHFRVHVDADSLATYNFYNEALTYWKMAK